MSVIKEIHFQSWDDFKYRFLEFLPKEQLSNNPEDPPTLLYRGQSDAGFHLTSSYHRRFNFQNQAPAKVALASFKHHISANGEYAGIHNNDNEIIALGQHYGMETHFLDWTESPYIAAFFAAQSALHKLSELSRKELDATHEQLAIWAINTTNEVWYKPKNEDKSKENIPKDKIPIWRPRFQFNRRLYLQKGWFTNLEKTEKELDLWAEEQYSENEGNKPIFWKFVIPCRDSCIIMQDLARMGINSLSLYLEEEGMAKHALDMAILSKFIEPHA
jgi:hypothetical protein